jgi:hypothetical protein
MPDGSTLLLQSTLADRLPSHWLAGGCRFVIGDPLIRDPEPVGLWRWCAEPVAEAGQPYCRRHSEEVRR